MVGFIIKSSLVINNLIIGAMGCSSVQRKQLRANLTNLLVNMDRRCERAKDVTTGRLVKISKPIAHLVPQYIGTLKIFQTQNVVIHKVISRVCHSAR